MYRVKGTIEDLSESLDAERQNVMLLNQQIQKYEDIIAEKDTQNKILAETVAYLRSTLESRLSDGTKANKCLPLDCMEEFKNSLESLTKGLNKATLSLESSSKQPLFNTLKEDLSEFSSRFNLLTSRSLEQEFQTSEKILASLRAFLKQIARFLSDRQSYKILKKLVMSSTSASEVAETLDSTLQLLKIELSSLYNTAEEKERKINSLRSELYEEKQKFYYLKKSSTKMSTESCSLFPSSRAPQDGIFSSIQCLESRMVRMEAYMQQLCQNSGCGSRTDAESDRCEKVRRELALR